MTITTTTLNVSAQRATLAATLAALVSGINTELAGVDPIALDGTSYPRADLLARIQAVLDAVARVKAARTTLLQVVASQKAALVQGRLLRAAMKRYLQSKYGPNSPQLQKFGIAPARTPKTSVESKAQAKAKAAATRTARGTKGKKAKLAIDGSPAAPAAPSGLPAAAGGTTK